MNAWEGWHGLMFDPILTKSDFVRRYSEGEFGNHSPTWSGYPEWAADNPPGDNLHNNIQLFHIRNRVAGAMTWYNVPKYAMEESWTAALQQFDARQLYISAMAPTERTTLQGEVLSDYRGLSLRFTKVRKPMREAFADEERMAIGLRAYFILQTACNSRSWDWLKVLLERYPDHVIEFSCYERCWGTEPGHNTIIWEVRRY